MTAENDEETRQLELWRKLSDLHGRENNYPETGSGNWLPALQPADYSCWKQAESYRKLALSMAGLSNWLKRWAGSLVAAAGILAGGADLWKAASRSWRSKAASAAGKRLRRWPASQWRAASKLAMAWRIELASRLDGVAKWLRRRNSASVSAKAGEIVRRRRRRGRANEDVMAWSWSLEQWRKCNRLTSEESLLRLKMAEKRLVMALKKIPSSMA